MPIHRYLRQHVRHVLGGTCGRRARAESVLHLSEEPLQYEDDTIEEYAGRPLLPLSYSRLNEMLQKASSPDTAVEATYTLRQEILTRQAITLRTFQSLPLLVTGNPDIQQVYTIFFGTFQELRRYPPITTLDEEREFRKLVVSQTQTNADLLRRLACGVSQIKRDILAEASEYTDVQLAYIDSTMDRLSLQRLGRRCLIRQYIACNEGGIMKNVDLAKAVKEVYAELEPLCVAEFGASCTLKMQGDVTKKITYVPQHLAFVLQELIKNSLGATAKTHIRNFSPVIPKLRVSICDGGKGAATIIIHDQGGGMNAEQMRKAWSYGYSVVKKEESKAAFDLNSPHHSRRFEGWGLGLPLCRQYLQFFGGSVRLRTMEGYGTDTIIELRDLKDWKEKDIVGPSHYTPVGWQ
eukprot:Sspe_Gene.66877::Locus_39505_Transcript_1_2_Confidence_0.750_Length_1327::g.66877::m.66877